MTSASRLASASRCSPRLGCRRPAVGETLTAAECLAPPRPEVCRSGLLGASVLDMVARPPLNLSMVAGSRVGELGSGPWEIGDGTPWRSVARPGWSYRRPGSSSFRVSEVLSNHSNSLPPPLLLELSLRQCWGPSHRGLGLCPLPGPSEKRALAFTNPTPAACTNLSHPQAGMLGANVSGLINRDSQSKGGICV